MLHLHPDDHISYFVGDFVSTLKNVLCFGDDNTLVKEKFSVQVLCLKS